MNVSDEKVAKYENLVDELLVVEKPLVAEMEARTKKGKEKKVPQVSTII